MLKICVKRTLAEDWLWFSIIKNIIHDKKCISKGNESLSQLPKIKTDQNSVKSCRKQLKAFAKQAGGFGTTSKVPSQKSFLFSNMATERNMVIYLKI